MLASETLRNALQAITQELQAAWPTKTSIEPPKDSKHGDLATNIALLLAKELHQNPRILAQTIAAKLELLPFVDHAEAAGPGFCNVFFTPSFWQAQVCQIEELGEKFGQTEMGKGIRVLVEFVSANPTGPLHVGHGRGAAVGDSLARLLKSAGYAVDTEYYVNDAGRQMRLLGLSVWLRAKELAEQSVTFPEEYYKGAYIIDLAKEMLAQDPHLLDLDEKTGQHKCYRFAMKRIMDGIVADLAQFRVHQDCFFSEKSLVEEQAVERSFQVLDAAHLTYEEGGAYWFASQQFGDDKDRVLKKSDGSLTYFASDIAYHHNKYSRGYDWLIDVWGADHHGYIARMRAAITAMGKEQRSFDVVLIQL
ncbi:MAG: arginine--tRNA ligase, partial [Desulfovibrio sp.]|nr:arginine--tRNA ligase [Desulfovibrio sp.]